MDESNFIRWKLSATACSFHRSVPEHVCLCVCVGRMKEAKSPWSHYFNVFSTSLYHTVCACLFTAWILSAMYCVPPSSSYFNKSQFFTVVFSSLLYLELEPISVSVHFNTDASEDANLTPNLLFSRSTSHSILLIVYTMAFHFLSVMEKVSSFFSILFAFFSISLKLTSWY